MSNKNEASFEQLIEMCNKVGWDNGINALEKIVSKNENYEVFLMEQNMFKQAHKLRLQIIKQIFSIAKLKQYRSTMLSPKP